MGEASTRKPEMVSVLERQVMVMEESLTSEMRTRRGGLMSGGGGGEVLNRRSFPCIQTKHSLVRM